MCLLVLAWKTHPDMPLLLSGNRDERHARATAAMDWWAERDWVGGRDLVAGGTWLAVARDGRYAVVTNYPKLGAPAGARSRGHLVPEFLASDSRPLAYLERVAAQGHRYAGFSLLAGDADEVAYYGNHGGPPRALRPGYYALGNDGLDVPSPRLRRARTQVAALLAAGGYDAAALFALWSTRPRSSTDAAPFIEGAVYGTRCTTVLRRAHDTLSVEEVSYGADGRAGAPRAYSWSVAG